MTFAYELTYGYANARLKAMKTRLIGKDNLFKLASVESLDDLVSFLEKTNYRQELVELSILYHGADLIDRALDMNIARKYTKVISMTPVEALDVVHALTGKLDVYNIKTILLGKHLGHDVESIEKLIVPAGSLDKRVLVRLNRQDSVREAVYFLGGTEYGNALIPLIKKYDETGDINILSSGLERQHFLGLTSSVKNKGREWDMISKLIKFELDSKNISALMRYVTAGSQSFDIKEALLPGGRLELKTLLKLKDISDIPQMVSALKSIVDLSAPLKLYQEDNALVHFEIELENRLYLMGLKAFRLSTLSVGSIVGFLYLKETEVGNLRKIVRGIEFKVPPEKIKETLVVI